MGLPPLVTVHLHRVPARRVPAAVTRVAADGARLRGTPGLRFAKLLGTGDGQTLSVRDVDPLRWALLAVWEDADALAAFERRSPVAAGWRRLAEERWRVDLRPLRSTGRWSGREPFGHVPTTAAPPDVPVAALTRARLARGGARAFWRAVPPVSADLRRADGLLLSLAIGEVPVRLPGTFSLWRDSRSLHAFAYRGAAHREVIARTPAAGWYAEELFARFAVVQSTGTVDGADPMQGAGRSLGSPDA